LIQEWKDGVRVGGREGVQINMKSGVFWNIWSIFTSGGSLLEYDRNSENSWLEMLMKWTMGFNIFLNCLRGKCFV
jgi:hypothetical protein